MELHLPWGGGGEGEGGGRLRYLQVDTWQEPITPSPFPKRCQGRVPALPTSPRVGAGPAPSPLHPTGRCCPRRPRESHGRAGAAGNGIQPSPPAPTASPRWRNIRFPPASPGDGSGLPPLGGSRGGSGTPRAGAAHLDGEWSVAACAPPSTARGSRSAALGCWGAPGGAAAGGAPSPQRGRGSGRWMAAALETKENSSVRSWVGGLGWRGRE